MAMLGAASPAVHGVVSGCGSKLAAALQGPAADERPVKMGKGGLVFRYILRTSEQLALSAG